MSPPELTSAAKVPPRCVAWLAAAFVTLAPAFADAHETEHIVTRGQTLYALAKRYGTTVEAIREANDLKPWQRLKPGDSLVIPDKGDKGKGRRAHQEARGARCKRASQARRGRQEGQARQGRCPREAREARQGRQEKGGSNARPADDKGP